MAMLNNQMVYYSVNIITNYSSMISMNYWYWLLWLDMIAKNAISIAPLYYTNNISLVISHGNARGNKYCSSIAIITSNDMQWQCECHKNMSWNPLNESWYTLIYPLVI